MSETTMSIRMTDERAGRLRRLMQATDESTKAKAFDVAAAHYLADLADDLSTPWLPIERETRVGRSEE